MGWKDAPVVESAPAWASAPEVDGSGIMQNVGNLVAGGVRGAGSIGATLLAPYDMAMDAIKGKGLSLESNRQRRTDMDSALQSMGAETDSMLYQGGKLGAEIAGTMGAGGAIANTVGRLAPGVAAAAPNMMNAIRTAGMTGGNAITRAAGGAITGGASAGLVDPGEAGAGALIGGAAPSAIKLAGIGGKAFAGVISGPKASADVLAAAQAGQKLGYVIPPTQVKPSLGNRLLEGFSGKLTTAQNASAKNAAVTDSLAAKAIGLAPDTKITPETLINIRETAGRAYADIGNTGMIAPGQAYADALDKIAQPFKLTAGAFPNAKQSPVIDIVESLRSPAFASASAVEKIKQLRSAADDAFRTGNTDVGRASKKAAAALEDAVEDHLKVIGQPDMLQKFRDARTLIAKTYTVEKALNKTTGTVDAKKLGAMLDKGKPLSGELKQAADFANQFPKAAQTVERMGSLPQTSPLDWGLATALGAATSNPLALLMAGARPASRAAVLSGPVQRGLTKQGPNALAALMENQRAQQLLYRGAPVIGASER